MVLYWLIEPYALRSARTDLGENFLMKNNSTQHILRLDQIYNLKTFRLRPPHRLQYTFPSHGEKQSSFYTPPMMGGEGILYAVGPNLKNIHSGPANYYASNKTLQNELYPMILSAWNGSRLYRTKRHSKIPPIQSTPRFNNLSNLDVKGKSDLIFSGPAWSKRNSTPGESMGWNLGGEGNEETNTQKIIKPNTTSLYPQTIDQTLGADFQWGNLKKDLWFMKTPFFQHIAWNMKHEILTRFLNSAYFSLRPSFQMNIGEEKAQSIILKGLLNRSGYLWEENQTDQKKNTVLAFNKTEQNRDDTIATSENTNFSRLEQDRLHKTNIEDSSDCFVPNQQDFPADHIPSEWAGIRTDAFNHPHGSLLPTQKATFLQNAGLNIYGGSWYFENLTFPYIRFSALRFTLPYHPIHSSRAVRQMDKDALEKKGSLKNFQLYSETNNFTPLSFRSVKSWCFSRMGINRRKAGFASSYIPLTILKLDSKSTNGIVQKDEHAPLEFLTHAGKWFPQAYPPESLPMEEKKPWGGMVGKGIKNLKGLSLHANSNQAEFFMSELLNNSRRFVQRSNSPTNKTSAGIPNSELLGIPRKAKYRFCFSASLYLNLAYNTNYLGSKINKLSYSPETKMESQLRWKEPEGPDIGIYSLAHKLASLGLHGVGRDSNSDTDIYPFKYNDYYRYNFQNKSIKYLPTYFSYSRKFLDFKNPIFSKIYAPLFQPQGLNLLSFVSQKITPSIDPNLKDFYNPFQIAATSTSTFNKQKSQQRKKDYNISNYSNPLLSQNIDVRPSFLGSAFPPMGGKAMGWDPNSDTTILDAGNKNWDKKILIGNNFSSESRFIKKQSCLKKPAIFFSSYRHLPYFLLSEKASTSSVQSDFDKFHSRVENFLPVPKSPLRSYETPLQHNYDNYLQPKEPYSKKNQALPDVSLQDPSLQAYPSGHGEKKEQWSETQRGEYLPVGVDKKSILKFEGDSNVTAPLHKSFTIKPLSAFIKREIGYQMSRFWFKKIDTLPYHQTSSLRSKWNSLSIVSRFAKQPNISKESYIPNSDKREVAEDNGKKIKRNFFIPYVFPTKSDLNNDKVILQENLWTIFPPLFQHLSFRFVDLNFSRTWSSHLKTHSDSSYYKESKLHDMTDGANSVSQNVGFRPLIQAYSPESLPMEEKKPWGLAKKNFFRFPLPLSFSDFFRLSLNENNQAYPSSHSHRHGEWSKPQNELENQNTIESNNNSYKESRVPYSWGTRENRSRRTDGFGLTQKSNWHSPNNAQAYSPESLPIGEKKKWGETHPIPFKIYFLFDPRESKNSSFLKNFGNSFDHGEIKREADTNSSDHALVFAEPIINFRRHLEQLDSKIYPLSVSRHNELSSKIGVYGEKPLLKTRTIHGPPLKNQKESISLPNYLKNITNQNYQNLCPNQLKELYFVFWILFSKTLFIYLSLHYLRKFITFLGTEYIRNLFKIFVTMKFIDGNILSIIKTFQDFNFQLNQQNVIDIKVNKQLKSVKRY